VHGKEREGNIRRSNDSDALRNRKAVGKRKEEQGRKEKADDVAEKRGACWEREEGREEGG